MLSPRAALLILLGLIGVMVLTFMLAGVVEETTLAPLPMPRGSSTAAMVVVSAFDSLKGCAAEQSTHATQLRAEVEKRFSQDDLSIVPGAISFRTKESESAKAWVSKRFLCLPDTR
jgi:hypothetical protein